MINHDNVAAIIYMKNNWGDPKLVICMYVSSTVLPSNSLQAKKYLNPVFSRCRATCDDFDAAAYFNLLLED